MGLDRRAFCKITGAVLMGALGRSIGRAQSDDVAAPAPPAQGAAPETAASPYFGAAGTRLAEESPLRARRWGMVIDLRRCVSKEGCTDCLAACHTAHNVPQFDNPKDEIKWIWNETFEHAFPDQNQDYVTADLENKPVLVFCNHCDNPPCVRVCPTGATWKRPDGIVMMDWHRCIGCRYCMAGCPYGSRSFNWRDPRPFIKKIDPGFPTRERGVVEKCTFCSERLARGLMPACVSACKENAMTFGDLEDPGSAVRDILHSRFTIRRKAELGTKPEIFYIA